jgi:hypothetical protein
MDAAGAEAMGMEGKQTPADNPEGGANASGVPSAPGKDPNFNFNVPLPEIIHIDRMSRISDVKSIWRSGIK